MRRKKTAVFLFDYTGIMAKPWADAGYLCYLVDSQHPFGVGPLVDGVYKVGFTFSDSDVAYNTAMLCVMCKDPDFVFGFPPCTDLAVSGAAHFAGKKLKDRHYRTKAMNLVYTVKAYGERTGAVWALENPVSVISTRWRKPDYTFDPWEYGGYLDPEESRHPTYPEYIEDYDLYNKKTCIWASSGFVMPTKISISKPVGYSKQHKKLGGNSLKTKNIRSATPRGFAKAVFQANGETP